MLRWAFQELDEVGSTQAVARRLAAIGAPEGTTVVARSQTSGKGRLGRTWTSPAGGLYMSFILRPENVTKPELITLIAALAVVDGVKKATGLSPNIRWPNDALIKGKKLAGVIAEAQSFKGKVSQIIVGMGVNCNLPESGMLALGEATSIEAELGRRVEISEIKHAVLDSFSHLYDRWKSGEDMGQVWKQKVSTIGKVVTVKLKTEENPFSCTARDIDIDGSLVVSNEGEEIAIGADDLEWLREQG